MEMARAFADIESIDRKPAEICIRSYHPVGKITAMGTLEVSAFEMVFPDRDLAFRGVRFEISTQGEFPEGALTTVELSAAEKLLASIEHLAQVEISDRRFMLSEVECVIDGLKVVVFNTEGGVIRVALRIDHVACHFVRQSDLHDVLKLVKKAMSHLQSNPLET